MIKAFYTSGTAAKNYQYSLDAVSHNIANVNTNGYKSQQLKFNDLLYDTAENGRIRIGTGSAVSMYRDNTQGTIVQSDRQAAGVETASGVRNDLEELSNVNLVREMANMMIAQRGYQLSTKMIQTADEIEQYANNLIN
jgi:flagellar basal-body rod protein FlgB